MIEYVAGFFFQDNYVALVKKNKPDWQKGLWNGIGGKIEKTESVLEAMEREFAEETGILLLNWRESLVLTDGRGWKVHFCRAFRDTKYELRHNLRKENDRGEELAWHPIDAIPKDCIPNLIWLIPFCYYQRLACPVFVIEPQAL